MLLVKGAYRSYFLAGRGREAPERGVAGSELDNSAAICANPDRRAVGIQAGDGSVA